MRKIKEVLIFALFLLAVVGCAAHNGVITESDETKSLYAELDAQIDFLSQQVIKDIKNTGYEGSRIIIISGSLIESTRYSVLENYVIKSFKRRLSKEGVQRDTDWSHPYELPFVRVVEPCREDWMPLKYGDPPLSLSEAEKFVILKTSFEPYKDMNKIVSSVSAYTFFHGKQEPLQINGTLEMDFSPCSLPYKLYQSDAPIPLPPGAEEKPYVSLEDLAYGLVSEVLADYPTAKVGVVDIKADPEMNRQLVRFLREAIEEYLIKNGLTIGVSRVDFEEVMRQYKFYHKHMIFEGPDPNKVPFSPATIYLFIDTRPGLSEELTIRTSLKALWLSTSDAGIYVRGLMGIAYAVPPIPMSSELWGQAIANTQKVDKKKLVNQAMENLKGKIIDYIRSNRINPDLGIIQKEVDAFVHRPGIIKTYTIHDRKFQSVKVIKGVSKGKVFCQFIWPLRRTVAVNYKENLDPDISPRHLNNNVCSRVQDILGRWGFDINNSDSQINIDITLEVRRVPSSVYSNRLDLTLSPWEKVSTLL